MMDINNVVAALVNGVASEDMELVAVQSDSDGNTPVYAYGSILVALTQDDDGVSFRSAMMEDDADGQAVINANGTVSRFIGETEYVYGPGSEEFSDVLGLFQHELEK